MQNLRIWDRKGNKILGTDKNGKLKWLDINELRKNKINK